MMCINHMYASQYSYSTSLKKKRDKIQSQEYCLMNGLVVIAWLFGYLLFASVEPILLKYSYVSEFSIP